jgi:H+-transporting ATPase
MAAQALQYGAVSPEAVSNTVIDLEKAPVDMVVSQLEVSPAQGLSGAEAQQRLAKYGLNALVEKEARF